MSQAVCTLRRHGVPASLNGCPVHLTLHFSNTHSCANDYSLVWKCHITDVRPSEEHCAFEPPLRIDDELLQSVLRGMLMAASVSTPGFVTVPTTLKCIRSPPASCLAAWSPPASRWFDVRAGTGSGTILVKECSRVMKHRFL